QEHLKSFYEYHNFYQQGDGYLEDGIPHIAMYRLATPN
ncbi:MAG: GNAT family N-acetyltransferase, partial [Bacteroidetes bacterium]|nr:GNAT family N-acetyltransferase [Bacteroidota bacterium]